MKAEFIVPFVEAASSICGQLTGNHPVRGEFSVRPELITKLPVNILCGITGDIEGFALFGLSKETAMTLARLLLNVDLRVFDLSVSDALIGLGDEISEQSSKSLSSKGVKLGSTPAALIRGTCVNVPTFGLPIISVALTIEEVGVIDVMLSVQLAKAADAA